MAFSHVLGGHTFTEAAFEGNAYATEATGFAKALEKVVEHVANAYRGTSTTSTAVGTGSKTLTVTNANSQIPAFAVGMPVRIARTSAPSTTFMQGEITAFNASTGAMTANVDSVKGSGTHTDWTITVGGNITTASASPLAVANGGTGATAAAAALTNLGALMFKTISVSGQDDVVADSATDTLTLAAGSGMTITTTAGSDTVTFASSGGATLSGSTNNGVATVTGANAIAAETKLLFDPPTLTIGNATAEDTKIVFDGNAQDFHIGLDDSEDSLTIGLGTALGTTAHIVIDATGAVTKPLQPAFLAYSSAVSNVTGAGGAYSPGNFANEVFDNNGDFNTTNFTFTAPVTGRYQANVVMALGGATSAYTRAQVRFQASNRDIIISDLNAYNVSQTDPAYRIAGSSLIDMDASDTLFITIYGYGGSDVLDWLANGYFSAYLVA